MTPWMNGGVDIVLGWRIFEACFTCYHLCWRMQGTTNIWRWILMGPHSQLKACIVISFHNKMMGMFDICIYFFCTLFTFLKILMYDISHNLNRNSCCAFLMKYAELIMARVPTPWNQFLDKRISKTFVRPLQLTFTPMVNYVIPHRFVQLQNHVLRLRMFCALQICWECLWCILCLGKFC